MSAMAVLDFIAKVACSLDAVVPVCEAWASSMMTAKVFVLEGLLSQDCLHRVREGLDGDHDDGRAFEQGFGQLLTFLISKSFWRSIAAINPFLVVKLLNCILKLAVENRPVCDDDDRVKDGFAVIVS